MHDVAVAADAVQEIDRQVAAAGGRPGPEIATGLVDLRHEAAVALSASQRSGPWPPVYDDPFPATSGRLPEVPAADLTTDVLGGAVAHHGALVVRGLFDHAQVAGAVDVVQRAAVARDAHGPGRPVDPWYRPFRLEKRADNVLRARTAARGGTWMADSPAATEHMLAELAASGVIEAVRGHLGERPCFSLQKSTLRCSAPEHKPLAAWHQDGSFLDAGVRTMNVWVALTPCGGDLPTPALEVVPARVEEVLPVGSTLAAHAIDFDLVKRVAGDVGTIVPSFDAGDAVCFDERFLHRSHLPEGMTHERLALECWLFAPGHVTGSYVPFLV